MANPDYVLPPVTITARKIPISTEIIPNPMHQFASWSYTWSLWWLDLEDFNLLMDVTDVADALAWQPSGNSWVVAEDSGRYSDKRYPGRP